MNNMLSFHMNYVLLFTEKECSDWQSLKMTRHVYLTSRKAKIALKTSNTLEEFSIDF